MFKRTAALGMDSLAMTDHGNLFGAYEFWSKAKSHGVFAKEVVVGTLDALYTNMARADDVAPEPVSIGAMLEEAVASVGTNLAALGDTFGDPLGMGNLDDSAAIADFHVAVFTLV